MFPAGMVPPRVSAKMIGVEPVTVVPGTTLRGADVTVTFDELMMPASPAETTKKHPMRLSADMSKLALGRFERHRFHDIRTHLKVRIAKKC